ncbi:hypothetical protein KUTeg_019827 [Tegillarca granosa]|uniref:Uncharacterized protein n=1 Tax=Tegillarca granosa TaxID=220873 RepID=A0ABQ9EHT7_TEGGR|nr:hypothetical protein KUTeg_019827 [Tegillarca granosa]
MASQTSFSGSMHAVNGINRTYTQAIKNPIGQAKNHKIKNQIIPQNILNLFLNDFYNENFICTCKNLSSTWTGRKIFTQLKILEYYEIDLHLIKSC